MSMDYLDILESEAIFILRETAAQFKRPVLLFSGGKDSICMVHLCKKAFFPGKFPFPLMHIDTGHNFPEVMTFRDKRVADLGERLIVGEPAGGGLPQAIEVAEQVAGAEQFALGGAAVGQSVDGHRAGGRIVAVGHRRRGQALL